MTNEVRDQIIRDICELERNPLPDSDPDEVGVSIEELAIILDRHLAPIAQALLSAREEVERLRAALETYGDHQIRCDVRMTGAPGYLGRPCSCGFSEALNPQPPKAR